MTTIRFESGALRLSDKPLAGELFFYSGELLMILRKADDPPEARRKVLTLRSPTGSEVLTVQLEPLIENPFDSALILDVKRWEWEVLMQQHNHQTIGSDSLGALVLTNEGLAIVSRLLLQRPPGPIVLVDPINGTVVADNGTTRRPHLRGWKLHALIAPDRWLTVAEAPVVTPSS